MVFNGLIIVLAVLFLPNGLLAWRMRRIAARRTAH
jgi:ABC-type branched-subunit amino acid transport system permease subunit